MKILITGATGFIGSALVKALLEKGHELVLLSRSRRPSVPNDPRVRAVFWNPDGEPNGVQEVDGADAVVNLAGEPMAAKRWTKGQKEKILSSRANATQIITRSIQNARKKPEVLINASAVGFYGPRGNEELTEESSAGVGFLADVCKAWEAHALRAGEFGVRVVRLRLGIVLARQGGALKMMVPPFRMFLGGWLASGNQWMSWIHLEDVVRLILFALENRGSEGAINATAPQPVTNKAFSMVLAQVIGRPCLAPVPAFVLKLMLGEMADLLLSSDRVIPRRARELGFSFRYPDIREALEQILCPSGGVARWT